MANPAGSRGRARRSCRTPNRHPLTNGTKGSGLRVYSRDPGGASRVHHVRRMARPSGRAVPAARVAWLRQRGDTGGRIRHRRGARARRPSDLGRGLARATRANPTRLRCCGRPCRPRRLGQTGGFSEAQMRSSYGETLRLSATQVDQLMADIWDWYCGELDEQLVDYVRTLRGRVRTGILSNSADGARVGVSPISIPGARRRHRLLP